jgi:Matrixin
VTRTIRTPAALVLVALGSGAFARATIQPSSTAASPPRGGGIYVWIQARPPLAGWRPDDVLEVERAFTAWNGIVPSVHFYFTNDSANAAVHVGWRDRFDEPMSGWTRVARDSTGTVTDASVSLAVHHPDGRPVTGEALRALATHEVGHLLGLGHAGDPRSIMSPVVRVRGLAPQDSAALRRLVGAEGHE